MTIILSDKQNVVKNDTLDWYSSPSRLSNNPYMTILGYAGTGKSTIVNTMISEMSINKSQIAFATYTGMAANVLILKGVGRVTTIHQLIYDTIPVVNTDPSKGRIGEVKFVFKLKDAAILKSMFKLIIIDEVSMVPQNMIDQLLSFQIPIIFLGDNEQLPPIYGDNEIIKHAHHLLEEIHRQALDNPIIYLSMLARQKKVLSYGTYGDTVQIIRQVDVTDDMLFHADQVIAAKNITVDYLNNHIRKEILGYQTDEIEENDKVICTANDWDKMLTINGINTFLVNGVIGTAHNIKKSNRKLLYKMDFMPIFSDEQYYEGLFADRVGFLPISIRQNVNEKELFILRKSLEEREGIQEFKFGYTITGHKSQGSEFDNVLAYNEVLNRKQHHRWLYTVMTRAKQRLILVM